MTAPRHRWSAHQRPADLRCPVGHPLSRDVRLAGMGAVRCRHRPSLGGVRGEPCGLWLLVVPDTLDGLVFTLAVSAAEIDLVFASGGRLSSILTEPYPDAPRTPESPAERRRGA